MLRFSFDGTVLTDRSDCKADRADLAVELTAETCGPMPPEVLAWFRRVVERAVLIEFDHFIAAGQSGRTRERLGQGRQHRRRQRLCWHERVIACLRIADFAEIAHQASDPNAAVAQVALLRCSAAATLSPQISSPTSNGPESSKFDD